MSKHPIKTFSEFWPFYLGEHLNATNRNLHLVGTGITLIFLFLAIAQRKPILLLGMPLSGYAFAWVGHFIFEKNRPATFKYPLWSLASDYKMFFYFLIGRLPGELEGIQESRS